MTTTAIREKLHSYISEADDDKIKNIYNLFEDQMAPAIDWSEDDEFVAELDDRMLRLKQGVDKGVSMEEIKAKLQRLREERSIGLIK